MYTLPAKTAFRIRKPSKALDALVAAVLPDYTYGKLTVELTDFVKRNRRAYDGRVYRWYDFATGETTLIYEAERQFEIEPGYALFECSGGDIAMFLISFGREHDQVAALDVARDAMLDGRTADCSRIAREALRHGWPLFLTLLQKEMNLLGR